MTINILTQERLKELLHYDAETGLFSRLQRDRSEFSSESGYRTHCRSIGKAINVINNRGYITIGIEGKLYQAHRLAWLYTYGLLPKNQIDHINHKKHDNRISNLRDVDNIENSRNRKIHIGNKSGCTGVSFVKKRRKWRAEIGIDGKNKFLGHFDSFSQAVDARNSANRKYCFHDNHGS